jgi:hypothetical protein
MKLRTARSVEHVAYMCEMRNPYRIWLGSMKEKDHSEDLCMGGKILAMDLKETGTEF